MKRQHAKQLSRFERRFTLLTNVTTWHGKNVQMAVTSRQIKTFLPNLPRGLFF
jgi:hypothetical protein